MTELVFASGNSHKYDEARDILLAHGFDLRFRRCDIAERQTTNVNDLTLAKCREAYSIVGRPLFVEHTCLKSLSYGGFPGGLTSVFLETVGLKGACEILGRPGYNKATAVTVIGYTNGRTIELFEGDLQGEVMEYPAVTDTDWKKFGWNAIFRPSGQTKSFAELGSIEKNKISMRRVALECLVAGISS